MMPLRCDARGRLADSAQHRRASRRDAPAAAPAPITKARRSPWLDERTALLVSLLAHNLTVTEDAARQDISDDLDHVARLMRIGRQAAKMYLTEDVISDMADRIAATVAEHQITAVASTRASFDLDTERRRRR